MQIIFCNCGRIHIIPKLWDWMAEDHENRSAIHVCTHCGETVRMFLTPYDDGFATNIVDVRDEDFEGNFRIIASRGVIVYMNSGVEADTFQSGYFANSDEWKMVELQEEYESLELSYKLNQPWCTVNTNRLIRDIEIKYKDEADKILNQLSGYLIKINWDGTKYARKF